MSTRYQYGYIGKEPRKKSSGVWVFIYALDIEGKRKQRKVILGRVKDMNRSQAHKAADAVRSQINSPSPRNTTLRQVVEDYLKREVVRKAASTQSIYASVLNLHLLPKWGDVPCDELSARDIEEWLSGLSCSPGSKAKFRNVLSAAVTHGIRYSLFTRKDNPVKLVRQPATGVRAKETLDACEITRLISALPVLEQTLVVLASRTGLRISEIRGLKWQDTDFQLGCLSVCRGVWHKSVGEVKTASSRGTQPIDVLTMEYLRAWRERTPYAAAADWVFANPAGSGAFPYWPEPRIRLIRKVGAQVGIGKHVTWHSFRRSFATLLVTNGVDAKTAQAMLRHASPVTTLAHYVQAVSTAKRIALELVGAQLDKQSLPSLTAGGAMTP